MPNRITTLATLFLLLIMAEVGCQKTSSPVSSAPAASSAKKTGATPEQSPTQTPVTVSAADVEAALTRTYQGAVVIDTTRKDSFVTGDFNGDNSEDIAIVVKPQRGKLADLNSEYANWILADAVKVGMRVEQTNARKLPDKSALVKVDSQDVLLAVIHGYREAGWKDSKAAQTFLLKNAVNDTMKTEARSRETVALLNQPTSSKGDIIQEIRGNKAGFIYWTGANYAWHFDSVSR